MIYDFKFSRGGFSCDDFTRKQASILQSVISGARLNTILKFNSYANISFSEEDKFFRDPHIEILDDYTNRKTNCMVYDIKANDLYGVEYKFDKIFIFQYVGKRTGYYGYILYNEDTKEYFHKYFVSYDNCDLCIAINKSLNKLR